MIYVILFLCGLAIAASLIFYALKQNLNVFVTPSQLATESVSSHYKMRLGGMVQKNSVRRDANSLRVDFIITDFKHNIHVQYVGVLPDLFHEGKGAIVEGTLSNGGIFIATTVLAKHDENYMPKKVYDAMRRNAGK